MQEQIRVTPKQNEYLLALKDGPKTTNWLMQYFTVTMATATKMLKIIRDAGLIESPHVGKTRGNVRLHSLITPYKELIENGMTVATNYKGSQILKEEILYAAILRNGLMTGQRLRKQYRKIYPNRSKDGIKNIVMTARKRKLCR